MTAPNPQTWANTLFVTDTIMNREVRDPLDFLLDPPRVNVRQTSVQAIGNGVWTSLNFDTEDYDNALMHEGVTNPSRLTATIAGWYQLSGSAAVNVTASMVRTGTRWAKNGAVQNGSGIMLPALSTGTGFSVPATTWYVFLAVNDYVQLQAFQSAAATVNTSVTGELQSTAAARLISG